MGRPWYPEFDYVSPGIRPVIHTPYCILKSFGRGGFKILLPKCQPRPMSRWSTQASLFLRAPLVHLIAPEVGSYWSRFSGCSTRSQTLSMSISVQNPPWPMESETFWRWQQVSYLCFYKPCRWYSSTQKSGDHWLDYIQVHTMERNKYISKQSLACCDTTMHFSYTIAFNFQIVSLFT